MLPSFCNHFVLHIECWGSEEANSASRSPNLRSISVADHQEKLPGCEDNSQNEKILYVFVWGEKNV